MAKIVFGPLILRRQKEDRRRRVLQVAHRGICAAQGLPNPTTLDKSRAVRANFTATAKAWSGTLTDAARAAFTQLAASLTRKDRFGQSLTLTGSQLYQSISRNLHTIGQPDLTTAPTSTSVSDLGGLNLAEVSDEASPPGGLGITLWPTNLQSVDDYIIVTGAAPVRAGVSFVGKGKYRVLAVIPPGEWDASPLAAYDITTAYENKFGRLAAGQTIHLQINNVNAANGFAGKPYPSSIVLV